MDFTLLHSALKITTHEQLRQKDQAAPYIILNFHVNILSAGPMNNPCGNFFLSPFLFLAFWWGEIRSKKQQKGQESEKEIDNIDINSYTTQSFPYLGFLSCFQFFFFSPPLPVLCGLTEKGLLPLKIKSSFWSEICLRWHANVNNSEIQANVVCKFNGEKRRD